MYPIEYTFPMPQSQSQPSAKPILLLDFDGVCHSYTSGWQGADQIPDPPVPGLFEFLAQALKYFDVQIYSSRSNQPGGIGAMKDWFLTQYQQWFSILAAEAKSQGRTNWPPDQDFPHPNRLKFPTDKPPAFLTLDDRAWCFTGQWPDPHGLLQFGPWNKPAPAPTAAPPAAAPKPDIRP